MKTKTQATFKKGQKVLLTSDFMRGWSLGRSNSMILK